MKRDTKVAQQYYCSHSLFMLEETWSKKQQDRSSCGLLPGIFTFNIVSYSYSNPAECYYLLGILLHSYSCGSQVKAQPSSGHNILDARSCVRRDYPSEVIDMYLIVLKVVRRRKLVSGKYLFITK